MKIRSSTWMSPVDECFQLQMASPRTRPFREGTPLPRSRPVRARPSFFRSSTHPPSVLVILWNCLCCGTASVFGAHGQPALCPLWRRGRGWAARGRCGSGAGVGAGAVGVGAGAGKGVGSVGWPSGRLSDGRPIVMTTVDPGSTSVPDLGSCLVTFKKSPSLGANANETLRSASLSSSTASLTLCPTTSGTVTV